MVSWLLKRTVHRYFTCVHIWYSGLWNYERLSFFKMSYICLYFIFESCSILFIHMVNQDMACRGRTNVLKSCIKKIVIIAPFFYCFCTLKIIWGRDCVCQFLAMSMHTWAPYSHIYIPTHGFNIILWQWCAHS